jgi:2-amino-4-hydroxy-6-hydroxymethyldihydropteridine diphosphokinase
MIDKIFLALGSNIGDRITNIKSAVNEINQNEKCRVLRSSAVYETTPYGNVEQPNFLNAVIEIETVLGFFELFSFIKSVEKRVGRSQSDTKWGPREIDIDIIFYNEFIYDGENLSVPHKEYSKRDFVLYPLLEMAPTFKHPVLRKRLAEINFEIPEKHIINKLQVALV